MSVVLERREPDPQPTTHSLRDRARTPPRLQFVTNGSEEARNGTRSRRSSRSSESPRSELSSAGDAATHKGDVGVAPADRAAEHAICRGRLVGWLFRPLLSDAFAMASLTRALSILGLGGKEQAGVLVRDMAAWFLALPVGRAADITVGREAQNCPVLRWLKGIIILVSSSSSSSSAPLAAWDSTSTGPQRGKELENEKSTLAKNGRTFDLFGDPLDEDAGSDGEGSTSDGSGGGSTGVAENASVRPNAAGSDERRDEQEAGSDGENFEADAEEVLRPMYEACAASERLENASMLSVVVAEALTACREKLEESSLGEVALGGEEAWATLARRLRLCLFVDHRLHWGMRVELRWECARGAEIPKFIEAVEDVARFLRHGRGHEVFSIFWSTFKKTGPDCFDVADRSEMKFIESVLVKLVLIQVYTICLLLYQLATPLTKIKRPQRSGGGGSIHERCFFRLCLCGGGILMTCRAILLDIVSCVLR